MPKIPPIKSELIPPRGAQHVGIHEDGRIIYEMKVFDVDSTKAAKTVKLDAKGEEVWAKHPTTGENLYPVLVTTPYFKTIRFVLFNDGNGNVRLQQGFETSAEDRAELAQIKARQAFAADLSEEAVRRGLTARELVGKILGEVADDDEHVEASDELEELVTEVESMIDDPLAGGADEKRVTEVTPETED